MKKCTIITSTNNGKSTEFHIFLIGEQYKKATELAKASNGKIGTNADGFLKVDFTSKKNNETFANGYLKWFNTSKTTTTVPVKKNAPVVGKGKALKDCSVAELKAELKAREKTNEKPKTGKKNATAPVAKTVVKELTAAEKKAIRSECYKKANGDRAKYDKLCKARGVDNGR